MRKKISLSVICILLIMFIAMLVAACNNNSGGGGGTPKIGKGLDVSFLRDLTFDLEGIQALGIEKRPTAKQTANVASDTQSNIAYAAEPKEKNKLVGEKEDESVVEIILRTKLGEIYKQDNLLAEFNKLCVSGEFVYFELIPEDVLETVGSDGIYRWLDASDFDERGGVKEGAQMKSTIIDSRDSWLSVGLSLENFDKKSSPSPIIGIFVYSLENEKIYDLSDVGYEVIDTGVVRADGKVCRTYINEEGEYETKTVFNDYTEERVADLWTDKYGNIFGMSSAGLQYEDSESRVFIGSNDIHGNMIWYVNDGEGQAVQLNGNGTVRWVDSNGLRDLQPGDNFIQRRKLYIWPNHHYWEGITDGVAKYYYSDTGWANDQMYLEMQGNIEAHMLTPTIEIGFVHESDGTLAWYDQSNKADGIHIITENFFSQYINPVLNSWGNNPDAFVVKTMNGETTYEFYWDEKEQTVKIRVQEEIIAPPKEVNKFQPIG